MTSKTIEARLVIAGEDQGASATIAKVVKAYKEAEKAAGFSDKVERLGKAYQDVERQMKAAGAVMSARGPLEATVRNLAAAEKEAGRLAKEYDTARKAAADFAKAQQLAKTTDGAQQAAQLTAEVKRLGAAQRAAEREARQLASAFQAQTSTLRSAEAAASKLGADLSSLERHQAGLARQADLATRALKAQIAAEEAGGRAAEARAARSVRRKEAIGTIAAGAGVLAAHEGKKIGLEAIQSAASFDLKVRKQRVFTDISPAEQAGLLKQAKQIGQETQFSNEDVVAAQTAAMQGLPASFAPGLKAAIAQGIVANVRNFSTLMETDLKEGTETIRSYLQATGKDISTKEKALAEANKAVNQIVKMAKLGGMNGEDAAQFVKYAAASSTSAGVSTDSMLALGALARRGGLRGDEAGVAMRSMASKIVAPTQDGIAALNAAGIKFSDFVHMPDHLSTDALEGQFQNKMGKGFTPDIRAAVEKINSDKNLIADRDKYTQAVVSAVAPMLGKTKDGTVRASDAKVAAKAVGKFHKLSAQSVDAEGLLDAAMKSKMTLPQLNAWLTDKHGGKGAITQRQWDEFKASREAIGHAGDDPDWAKKKADEVFAGIGGSVENLKGSFENLILTIGTANEGLIKWTADLVGQGLDAFSNLSKGQQQAVSLGGGAAALGTGAYGAYKLTKNILGFGGGGAALNGSAAALTQSAALLDAAAIKLAGGVPGGGVPEVLKKGGKALPLLAGGAVLGGTAAIGYILSEYGDPTKSVNGTGGKPDFGMNPGDELPGVPGSSDAPSWAPAAKKAGEAIGTEVAKGIPDGMRKAPPLNPGDELPGLGPDLKTKATEAGTDAGTKAGEGIRSGIETKAPEVEAQGQTLFQRLKDTFSQGINIPINFAPGEGLGGGSGVQTASFGGSGGGGSAGGLIHRASLGGASGAGDAGGGGNVIEAPGGAAGQAAAADVAARYVGMHEARNRAELVRFTGHEVLGRANAWCATFVNASLAKAGIKGSGSAVATSFLRWGRGVSPEDVRKGDVLVEGRGLRAGQTGGHVSLATGRTRMGRRGLEVETIQGNSGNQVRREWEPASKLNIRRGREPELPEAPTIPDAPPGGLGGGRAGQADHVAEFGRHVDRLADMGFHGTITLAGTGNAGVRATGMQMRTRGPLTADLGVSMPGAKESDSDWI